MTTRRPNLLTFQWSVYAEAHQNRRNLAIHLATVPIFMAGNVLLLASPWVGLWAAPAGLAAMGLAMAAQGRGHRAEANPPPPFRGPLDVLLRILAEQWITWPRFVLSGALARAWRGARRAQHAVDAPAAP
jgi:hypothetical protein